MEVKKTPSVMCPNCHAEVPQEKAHVEWLGANDGFWGCKEAPRPVVTLPPCTTQNPPSESAQ